MSTHSSRTNQSQRSVSLKIAILVAAALRGHHPAQGAAVDIARQLPGAAALAADRDGVGRGSLFVPSGGNPLQFHHLDPAASDAAHRCRPEGGKDRCRLRGRRIVVLSTRRQRHDRQAQGRPHIQRRHAHHAGRRCLLTRTCQEQMGRLPDFRHACRHRRDRQSDR